MTLKAIEVFNEGEYLDWLGLQTLVQVERLVSRLERETRQEKQYYISSLALELCKELRDIFEDICFLRIDCIGI